MEITPQRVTILKLLEDKEPLSSDEIKEETSIPEDILLSELKYFEKMKLVTVGGKSFKRGPGLHWWQIKLSEKGQETLEQNRNLWTKIRSQIKGFQVFGCGLELK